MSKAKASAPAANGRFIAIVVAMLAVCVCPPRPKAIDWREIDAALVDAARKTDREVNMERMRLELEEILRRNRKAFERGER